MKPEAARICFILLRVRDDPIEQAPLHMGKAFEIIVRRDGNVWGSLPPSPSPPSACL